jgi:hypothetical protein
VTLELRQPPLKPLPIVVKPGSDELLSSWLRRTADVYRITATDVLEHLGIDWPDRLRQVDFAPSPQIKTRLA